MPFITVEMWAGRSDEQKEQLVKDITEAFTKIGADPSHVHVILKDNDKTNCAIGGKLANNL